MDQLICGIATGKNIIDKINEIIINGDSETIDDVPTDGSTNAVSSNGVYDSLLNKSDIVHIHTHNSLSELENDDHLQYYNQTRGDARYSQIGHLHTTSDVIGLQAQLDNKVDGSQVLTNVPAEAVFTDTIYTHPTTDGNLHVPATGTTNSGKVLTAGATAGSISWQEPVAGITDHTLFTNIGTNTHAQIDTHISDATKHRVINDAGTLTTELWSASKISSELALKSSTSHAHSGVYEPIFTKNTGFNKNFGTIAGTVAEGNDSRIVNGETAYTWGNHALSGYLTSFTETDPIFNAHTVKNITNGTGLLKNNGTGTWSWDNNSYSLTSHTHTGVYEPANSYLMKTNVAQTMSAQLTVKETKETYYTMTGTVIDPANGTIQLKEITESVTLTEVLESGQSITLMLKDADLYTLTLPALTWCTVAGNVAPEWTGLDTIVLWKVSTVLFGAYLGSYK